MKAADGRSHALVFKSKPAAGVPFRAQRLKADEKPFEALLAPPEQIAELAIPALSDQCDRSERLIDHGVVRGTIRESRHNGAEPQVDDDERQREEGSKGHAEHG
jgi:hypothetical protein